MTEDSRYDRARLNHPRPNKRPSPLFFAASASRARRSASTFSRAALPHCPSVCNTATTAPGLIEKVDRTRLRQSAVHEIAASEGGGNGESGRLSRDLLISSDKHCLVASIIRWDKGHLELTSYSGEARKVEMLNRFLYLYHGIEHQAH